jgi:60 kDa SS-A/Ro ribonucleoprotein
MRVNTAAVAKTVNHEGTPVKALSPEQELRRSVLACMLWEGGFYESGQDAAARISALVKKVGFDKTAAIAIEAREKMKLRHVPLLLARQLATMGAGRKMGDLLERIIQRPDELTEFLALYWKDGKKPLAKQVKVGLARAFRKFDEYALAKYNRDNAVKLRDVLFLSHAKPKNEEQAALRKRLVDGQLVTPDTWEVALSGGADKREVFTRLIGEGKLFALAMLRNLRNMIEAKVDDSVIRAGLASMKVERVLPFRFIAAAKYAPRFEPELEQAMFKCLGGADKLAGRTALVVDTSPSMWQARISAKSEMDRFEAAAALAILLREVCEEVRVYAFNEKGYEVAPRRGFALRDALNATKGNASCGGLAVAMANDAKYDRIVVLTDGQWHYSRVPGGQLDSEGDALVISPAPLTEKAYMVNMAATKNGVGYGKWLAIDGWSEAIVEYIRAAEALRD